LQCTKTSKSDRHAGQSTQTLLPLLLLAAEHLYVELRNQLYDCSTVVYLASSGCTHSLQPAPIYTDSKLYNPMVNGFALIQKLAILCYLTHV
jgi:hypothetical protein